MEFQYPLDLMSYAIDWIQGCLGVLKDHGDFSTPNLTHFSSGLSEQIAPFPLDPAARYSPAGREQAKDGVGQYCFARTRFANKPQRISFSDTQTNPIKSAMLGWFTRIEVYSQPLNLKEVMFGRCHKRSMCMRNIP